MMVSAGCMACMSVQTGVLVQESELVEARLERSQAEAKAQRAQQRLDDFLAHQPAHQVCLQPGYPLSACRFCSSEACVHMVFLPSFLSRSCCWLSSGCCCGALGCACGCYTEEGYLAVVLLCFWNSSRLVHCVCV